MNERAVNDVFSVFEYLKDSIKVTRRSINKDLINLHNRTVFFAEPKDAILNKMSFVDDELDDIIILSLFSSFERELRTSIQLTVENKISVDNSTVKNITKVTIDGIERWSINDMIDILKEVVDDTTRSRVKQIYEYRNWVAHGKNPTKPPSTRADPKSVYLELSKFISQAKHIL